MVMVDTGFWLALANKKDEHHEKAKSTLATLNSPLITTWPVMTETCSLPLMRLDANAPLAFIKSYGAGAFKTFDLSEKHAGRIHELMEQYANLPMDLADASLVILAEHLGHGRILSTAPPLFRSNNRWSLDYLRRRIPFDKLTNFWAQVPAAHFHLDHIVSHGRGIQICCSPAAN